MKKILIIIFLAIVVLGVGVFVAFQNPMTVNAPQQPVEGVPQNVTHSGTYVCLPLADTTVPATTECRFGLKTDDGMYYAVNFGQSASARAQFDERAHITAEGFTVARETLNSDEWGKYTMKGIFTITRVIDATGPITATPTNPQGTPTEVPVPTPTATTTPAPAQGKLNINEICEGTLAYTTFTDGASADAYVAECKAGKHPEVIEQYKQQMGLGDGAAI